MKKVTQNTFNDGLNLDLNPLVTPPSVLTDCINGTFITFNDNEFVLQNDMGNIKLDKCVLKKDFIPLGVKEYGGIIYIASHNPLTGESEIGSFPSPEVVVSDSFNDLKTSVSISDKEFLDSNGCLNFNTNIKKTFGVLESDIIKVGDKFVVYLNSSITTQAFKSLLSKYKYTKDKELLIEGKLFKMNLIKIDTNGNISILDDSVKQSDSGNFYFDNENINLTDDSYYSLLDGNTNGYLALLVSVEKISNIGIDVYTVNVTETSFDILTLVQDIGNSESYNRLLGYTVECYVNDVLYASRDVNIPESDLITVNGVNKIPNPKTDKTLKFTLEGIGIDSSALVKIKPYTAYNYLKDFEFEKNISKINIPEKGDVFKYKSNIIDTPGLAGDIEITLELPRFVLQNEILDADYSYIEFYDVWSKCSMIKNISTLSNQSIRIDLVNYEFNNTEYEGIPANKITNIIPEDGNKNKLNPLLSKLIYTDDVLRKNGMYVVNIICCKAGFENIIATHTLYTNGIFNENYDSSINNFDELNYKFNNNYLYEELSFTQNLNNKTSNISNVDQYWDVNTNPVNKIENINNITTNYESRISNIIPFNLFDNNFKIKSVESKLNDLTSKNGNIKQSIFNHVISGNSINLEINNNIEFVNNISLDIKNETKVGKFIEYANFLSNSIVKSRTYSKLLYIARSNTSSNTDRYNIGTLSKFMGMQPYSNYNTNPNGAKSFLQTIKDKGYDISKYENCIINTGLSNSISDYIKNTIDQDGNRLDSYDIIPYITGVTIDVLDRSDGTKSFTTTSSSGISKNIIFSNGDKTKPSCVACGLLVKNSNGEYISLSGMFKEDIFYSTSDNDVQIMMANMGYEAYNSALHLSNSYKQISKSGDVNVKISDIRQEQWDNIYRNRDISNNISFDINSELITNNGEFSQLIQHINSLIYYPTSNNYSIYNNVQSIRNKNNIIINKQVELLDRSELNIYKTVEQSINSYLESMNVPDNKVYYYLSNKYIEIKDIVQKDNFICSIPYGEEITLGLTHTNTNNIAKLFKSSLESQDTLMKLYPYSKTYKSFKESWT